MRTPSNQGDGPHCEGSVVSRVVRETHCCLTRGIVFGLRALGEGGDEVGS